MKVDIVKYKRDGGRIIMKGIDIAESRPENNGKGGLALYITAIIDHIQKKLLHRYNIFYLCVQKII